MSEAKSNLAAFEREVDDYRDKLVALLPQNVPVERFRTTLVSAVAQNPALLTINRGALFGEICKAAEDGLLPDGREGVINVYSMKVKGKDGKEAWVKLPKWIPMVFGMRKRAMELADIIIDAQVVHKGDRFHWRQGDDAAIEHEPVSLEATPGPMIGSYAIFRKRIGTEIVTLHREVLRLSDIVAIKKTVKAATGLMWTAFEGEAWRKSAVRRGIKTVPAVDPALMRIVSREDDMHRFAPQDGAAPAPPRIGAMRPKRPPTPPAIDRAGAEDAISGEAAAPAAAPAPEAAKPPTRSEAFLVELDRRLGKVGPGQRDLLQQVWDRNERTIEASLRPEEKQRAYALWDKHSERIAQAAAEAAE